MISFQIILSPAALRGATMGKEGIFYAVFTSRVCSCKKSLPFCARMRLLKCRILSCCVAGQCPAALPARSMQPQSIASVLAD